MKISWGTGIIIALGLFISYIMFMVITMMSTHTDIVELDYYAQQIKYQDTKEAKENGLAVIDSVDFQYSIETIDVVFFYLTENNAIKSGSIYFYRPEDARLDKKFDLNPQSGSKQSIPLKQLTKGSYLIKLSWEDARKEYLIEKRITI